MNNNIYYELLHYYMNYYEFIMNVNAQQYIMYESHDKS